VAKTYTIGTRGSLLALTQSTMTKNLLEQLTGDTFNLKVIETQGDQVTDVPLWQLEGKDFFTKELDAALLTGEIDLDIHSYKDLGSERPEGIALAAITKRKFAHDVLLVKKDTAGQIAKMKEFVVGTSSPRRIVNIEKNLADFLPNPDLAVSTKVLRGNINTRIKKLQNNDYHAIVLALAGVERLATHPESRKELNGLLDGLTFMILPQSIFTSAASQGALGIECLDGRDDGGELKEKLAKLSDEVTMEEMSVERKLFAHYGGGCHLAVGINALKVNGCMVVNQNGSVDDREIVSKEISGLNYELPAAKKLFIGLPADDHKSTDSKIVYDSLISKKSIDCGVDFSNKNLYVTSRHCLASIAKGSAQKTTWSAGVETWKRLAKQGEWVHGTADSLGEERIAELINSQALNLITPLDSSEWFVLSNETAKSELGRVITVYDRVVDSNDGIGPSLESVDIFYWTSFYQYQTYVERFPFIKDRPHCCGFGKSYQQFKQHAIEVTPFISILSFKKTVNA
jgi:hydroxymethylbilane synthase